MCPPSQGLLGDDVDEFRSKQILIGGSGLGQLTLPLSALVPGEKHDQSHAFAEHQDQP